MSAREPGGAERAREPGGAERAAGLDDASVRECLRRYAHGPLGPWLGAQRWFGARGRRPQDVVLGDYVPLGRDGAVRVLGLFDVALAGGAIERYAVPLALTAQGRDPTPVHRADATIAVEVAVDDAGETRVVVTDAGGHAEVARALYTLASDRRDRSEIARWTVRPMGAEQSNTSWVLAEPAGNEHVVKLYRRLQVGVQPDVEVPEFLTRAGFAGVAGVEGVLRHRVAGRGEVVLAVVQAFVPNRGDGWTTALAALRAIVQETGTAGLDALAAAMGALGGVTGAMHAALAGDHATGDFTPEPMTADDRAVLAAGMERHLAEIAAALPASRLARDAVAVAAVARRAAEALPALDKIRVHGDYHLGQVLATGGDQGAGYVVIDFEGEPLRPLAERRARASALRDAAGMLRSFSYAATTAAREAGGAAATARAAAWEAAARARFVAAWVRGVGAARARLVPEGERELERALAVYELEKALYEVVYELRHRPEWVAIPLAGVERALAVLAG